MGTIYKEVYYKAISDRLRIAGVPHRYEEITESTEETGDPAVAFIFELEGYDPIYCGFLVELSSDLGIVPIIANDIVLQLKRALWDIEVERAKSEEEN